MFDYKDKLVLITGASSGLGLSLAGAYYRSGAHLVLVARRIDRIQALAQQLDPSGKRVTCMGQDLLDMQRIPSMVEEVVRVCGRPVDVLAHCAGMSCYGEIERTPFQIIENVTSLNYLSGIRLIQCVLEAMKRQKNGQIVWIGSGSSFRGIPRAGAYSASKAAVKCFCEALRSELNGSGIDVLLVIPGALKTDFHAHQPNFSSDGRLRAIGSPSDPDVVAKAIVKAGQRQRSDLVYGRYAWIGKQLSCWAPWLLDRLLRIQLK